MEAETCFGAPGTDVDCPHEASRWSKTPTSWRVHVLS
jgi:hypothetical protein